MTSWTNIADNRLEPGKPARSIDAIALRDNPIAIAENAANAPKVQQYHTTIVTSDNWTVPKTGNYEVTLVGGGSGGQSGGWATGTSFTNGTNGASGQVVTFKMAMTQGTVYAITIGTGGNGGSGYVQYGLGAAGGNTTFGNAIALGGVASGLDRPAIETEMMQDTPGGGAGGGRPYGSGQGGAGGIGLAGGVGGGGGGGGTIGGGLAGGNGGNGQWGGGLGGAGGGSANAGSRGTAGFGGGGGGGGGGRTENGGGGGGGAQGAVIIRGI